MEGEPSDLADSSVTPKGPGPVVPRVLAVMAWLWLLVAISGLTDVDSSLRTFLLLDGSGLLLTTTGAKPAFVPPCQKGAISIAGGRSSCFAAYAPGGAKFRV